MNSNDLNSHTMAGAPISPDLPTKLPSWVESTVESVAYQGTQAKQESMHPITLHTVEQPAWVAIERVPLTTTLKS
jgi:hypothetical protein